jgi:hypothetical protein
MQNEKAKSQNCWSLLSLQRAFLPFAFFIFPFEFSCTVSCEARAKACAESGLLLN